MRQIDIPSNGKPLVEDRTFHAELTALINKHSLEGGSCMPGFIIADFLCNCLDSLNQAATHNLAWASNGSIEGIGVTAVGRNPAG